MAKAKADISWVDNFHFIGKTQTGFEVHFDSPTNPQMAGPAPKELILHSLAVCSMMDIVLIIKKAKKDLQKFRVEVEADAAETHPKKYLNIHLKYIFLSPDLDQATAEKAIRLSKDNYCSVSAMLKDSVKLSNSFEIFKNESDYE